MRFLIRSVVVLFALPAGLAWAAPLTGPVWVVDGNQTNANLGSSVSSAGDVNGDGYADLIVGAWQYWVGGPFNEGAAFVYLGSPTGPSTVPASILRGGEVAATLGFSVSTAGDVNGDGYADVIVGAPYIYNNNRPGRVEVYLGSASGLSSLSAWTAYGQ